jgi:two-component SAPR family response regulator
LDAEEFEAKLTTATRESETGKLEKLYRQTLALYRGDFLADLDAYMLDCWAERERYRRLYLDALHSLGDILSAQNQDDEAMDTYRKILAEDPCAEAVARKLMRLTLEMDERAKALSQYARLEENLERILGIEPSQETYQLQQEAKFLG